jgi:hypothetical protein
MPSETAAQFNIHEAKTNLSRIFRSGSAGPGFASFPSAARTPWSQAGFRWCTETLSTACSLRERSATP